ncbi:MAG: hypothetical protein QF903_12160 [Planctomycetota bacterium]|jgi:apolipoprotein N-acyltransferase|nr:hypothetical protein [Planctomycetota bacterium]MDP6764388.1 hypothetical protein [Planctomycetota bacterium]MDP6990215.1 hypothetical protein [Planctomycetota bacterium]
MKPHRGVIILVFGILGFVVCPFLGVAAWVMGSGDIAQIDAGTMDPEGRSLTQAGKVCGIVSSLLGILWLGLSVLMLLGVYRAAAA